MFQSEMENLGLGLGLASSDMMLFPDELFNVPLLDQQQQQQQQQKQTGDGNEQDLLQKVIEEIKMAPMEVVKEQNNSTATYHQELQALNSEDTEMKSILADYNDLLFEDAPQLTGEVASVASPSAASTASSVDDTQSLIEEMEEFLNQHEVKEEEEEEDRASTVSPAPSAPVKVEEAQLTEAETRQAEQIVEALVSGDLSLPDPASASEEQRRRLAAQAGVAVGSATISNISEIITENGDKIVIVVANDQLNQQLQQQAQQQAQQQQPVSPSSSAASSDQEEEMEEEASSDPEWSPESTPAGAATRTSSRQKQRKTAAAAKANSSTPAASSSSVSKRRANVSGRYNVRDKKERKKLQNVVAARRYRDKKKSEQAVMEQEEQELEDKNRELRERLSETESELRTLKKLMVELGLVKVGAATARELQKQD